MRHMVTVLSLCVYAFIYVFQFFKFFFKSSHLVIRNIKKNYSNFFGFIVFVIFLYFIVFVIFLVYCELNFHVTFFSASAVPSSAIRTPKTLPICSCVSKSKTCAQLAPSSSKATKYVTPVSS